MAATSTWSRSPESRNGYATCERPTAGSGSAATLSIEELTAIAPHYPVFRIDT